MSDFNNPKNLKYIHKYITNPFCILSNESLHDKIIKINGVPQTAGNTAKADSVYGRREIDFANFSLSLRNEAPGNEDLYGKI